MTHLLPYLPCPFQGDLHLHRAKLIVHHLETVAHEIIQSSHAKAPRTPRVFSYQCPKNLYHGIRGRIFHFDNLASTHESQVLTLRIKNTYKTSPHAKPPRVQRTAGSKSRVLIHKCPRNFEPSFANRTPIHGLPLWDKPFSGIHFFNSLDYFLNKLFSALQGPQRFCFGYRALRFIDEIMPL